MKPNKLTSWLTVALLLSTNTFGFAQKVQVKQIINGEGLPPYLKMSAVTPDHKAVKLELAKGGTDGGPPITRQCVHKRDAIVSLSR